MATNTVFLKQVDSIEVFVNCVDNEKIVQIQNESHVHKEYEIYVNLSGDVAFEVERHIYPISRGSVLITRPYEYHRCIIKSDQAHHHYWVLIKNEGSEALFDFFFHRNKGEYNLIQLNEDELTELTNALQVLLKHDKDYLDQNIAFLNVLQILKNGNALRYTSIETGLPDVVTRALKYMDDNLALDFSIEHLAKICCVSINTLEKIFKKFLHKTPHSILQKKRLIYSCELLRNGHSVSEACEKCGFNDYSNYIARFRKTFGLTPLKYQKEVRKEFV